MIVTTGADPAALKPGEARDQLRKRAAALAAIRGYFSSQHVLEVSTPELLPYGSSDPQLHSFALSDELLAVTHYLQTSPESAMKQLLAKGSGSIFQICKAFRRDQPGKLHAFEFTLLEWYRTNFSLAEIIDDTLALVSSVIAERPVEVLSYRDAFLRHAGVDPFVLHGDALRKFARQKICLDFDDDNDDIWLDLLLTHLVEPRLGRQCFTIVQGYPPSQAAMAEIIQDTEGNAVAARFELYLDGVELANGYQELTDAAEQYRRFEHDNACRRARGLPAMPVDQPLLNAMRDPGLPACAGVALGIDRLMLFA